MHLSENVWVAALVVAFACTLCLAMVCIRLIPVEALLIGGVSLVIALLVAAVRQMPG